MSREKIQNIVNSVLATAVVVLFVLHFTCGSKSASESVAPQEVQVSGELMPIALVNTDSILVHYTLAVESSDRLQTQYENSVMKLADKEKALQKEAETCQAGEETTAVAGKAAGVGEFASAVECRVDAEPGCVSATVAGFGTGFSA